MGIVSCKCCSSISHIDQKTQKVSYESYDNKKQLVFTNAKPKKRFFGRRASVDNVDFSNIIERKTSLGEYLDQLERSAISNKRSQFKDLEVSKLSNSPANSTSKIRNEKFLKKKYELPKLKLSNISNLKLPHHGKNSFEENKNNLTIIPKINPALQRPFRQKTQKVQDNHVLNPVIKISEYIHHSNGSKQIITISDCVSKRSNLLKSEYDQAYQNLDSFQSILHSRPSLKMMSPHSVMKKLQTHEQFEDMNEVINIKHKTATAFQRIKTQINGKSKERQPSKMDSTIDANMGSIKKKVQSIQNYQPGDGSHYGTLDLRNYQLTVSKKDNDEFLWKNINNDSQVFKEKMTDKFLVNQEVIYETAKEIQQSLSQLEKKKTIYKKQSTNNIKEIQLIKSYQQSIMTDREEMLEITEEASQMPSEGGTFNQIKGITDEQCYSKRILYQTDESFRDYNQDDSKHKRLEDKRFNEDKSHREFYGRIVQKDTYSSIGSPNIIITRPPDESSESNRESNIQSTNRHHNTLNTIETEQTTHQSHTIKKYKFKLKKNPKDGDFIIEIIEDQQSGQMNGFNKSLKVVRKKSKTNTNNEYTKNLKINNENSQEHDKNDKGSVDSSKTPPKSTKRRRRTQLYKLINNILIPLSQGQFKSNRSKRRVSAGGDEGFKLLSTKKDEQILLQVQRLKTLAEVDEDDEKSSVWDNSSFVTSFEYDHQNNSTMNNRSENNDHTYQMQKQQTREQQFREQNSKSVTPFDQPQQTVYLQQQQPQKVYYIQQKISPQEIKQKQETIIAEIQKQQKDISRSKNMISMHMINTNNNYKVLIHNQKEQVQPQQKEETEYIVQQRNNKQSEKNITQLRQIKMRKNTDPNVIKESKTEKIRDDVLETILLNSPTNDEREKGKIIIKKATEMANRIRKPDYFLSGKKNNLKSEQTQNLDEEKEKKIKMQIKLALLAQQPSFISGISSNDFDSISHDLYQSGSESYYYEEEEYDIEEDSDDSDISYTVNTINFSECGTTKNMKKREGESSNSSISPKNKYRHLVSLESQNILSQQVLKLDSERKEDHSEPKFETRNNTISDNSATVQPTITNKEQTSFKIVKSPPRIQTPQLSTRKIITFGMRPTSNYLLKVSQNNPPDLSRSKSQDYKIEVQEQEEQKITKNENTISDQNLNNQEANTQKPLSLLTPENLQQLENSSVRSGPRSITTNSVISGRKNGKKKINQYIVNHIIGQGKFSKVYQCMNEQDKKVYAMKVVNKKKLNRQFKFSKKTAYNFVETETAILKKLDHPNVLTLYELMDDPNLDKLYYITDFVKNGNLKERIDRRNLEMYQIRSYFRDLISALEYCHECACVIHRDIKPENILIDENNRIKLADFGVSHIMENGSDMIDTKAGTNFYFSPEICKGASYRGRPADVWACGVVLYYMATKKFPFQGQNVNDLFERILNSEPDYTEIRDKDLEDLLKKILEKQVDQRITISQIKEHPWVTNHGKLPMVTLSNEKIEITQQDLKTVITRVVQMNRIMKKFKIGQKDNTVPTQEYPVNKPSLTSINLSYHNSQQENASYKFSLSTNKDI